MTTVALRSVLCPVDFSEQSRHALRWAGEFVARYQGHLTVLSAVDPLLAEAARVRFGQDLAKEETAPALRDFVAATWPDAAAPSSGAAFNVQIGDPADVILKTAIDEAVELIVMGTQGLGGFRKWLLGSTTERVLRHTSVPVVAVPPASKEPAISRMLAATDFSESSVAAVRFAVQLAHKFSATLTLAHVLEPLTVPPQWRSLVEDSDETRVADARARLDELGQQVCGSRGCDVVVSVGRPADAIGSVADERRIDLIVMGLTGDYGPLAPRPGSIAYRVLCSTTVPVLVVPPSSNQ